MAVIAGVATRDVCRILPARGNAIVAGPASANNLEMIDGVDRRPGIRTVAVLADISGLYVCEVFAGGIRTIVTVDAIVCDIGVIEVGGYPAGRRMTVIAIIAGVEMRRVLAGGS